MIIQLLWKREYHQVHPLLLRRHVKKDYHNRITCHNNLSVCSSVCLSICLSICLPHSERESSELRGRLEADLLQVQAQLREERRSQSVSDLEGEGPESSSQFRSSNGDSSTSGKPTVSDALHTPFMISMSCVLNSLLLFM